MAPLAAALLLFAPLAGCQRVERLYDSKLTADTPVDWWHQLEGGAIAEDRPPPPGASAPYPNLDQVPGQTPAVNAAAQQTLETQLLAERDQVRRNVVQDPLSASPPNQPVAPPPLPSDPEASHVVADAASAATTSATVGPAPAAVPGPASQAAPPVAPAAAGSASPSPPTPARPSKAPPPTARAPATAASSPSPSGPPTVPDAPPPLPQLAGIDASLVPAASRPPPPGVAIGFRRGSAELPLAAVGALQALAARRAGGPIAVLAGGDSGLSPATQAAALPLALRRADAVRAALVAVGVPAGDVRATALATARGTRADLIQSP